jgi:hypothetical protein
MTLPIILPPSPPAPQRSLQKVCDLYHAAACTPSDIWQHIPLLLRLGRMCDHITEFGTRTGVSTAAFLRAEPKTLVTYDVVRHPEVRFLEEAAEEAGLTFLFREQDVLTCEILVTDLLFIDTKHTFLQLRRELLQNGDSVRKFIVMHDTETYGRRGEMAGDPGLMPAIEEYFGKRSALWKLIDHCPNNNGLSIYMRRDQS